MSEGIAKVCVIGAGTMGTGIAAQVANAGVPVKLLEVDDEALQRALQRARDTYATSVKRGSLSEAAMAQRLALIEGITDYAALADVDLVVEAVFEDMAVKQQVFERLDAVCKPGAILASNTSSLDLNAIAAFTRRSVCISSAPPTSCACWKWCAAHGPATRCWPAPWPSAGS